MKGAGDRDGPLVQISSLVSAPFAVGAFMGAKRPQLPPWIGNQSTRGDDPARGSYGMPGPVADSISRNDAEIEHEVIEAINTAARRVGLDK